MKREKSTEGQEWILVEHLDGLKRNDFCDFDKPRKRAYQNTLTDSKGTTFVILINHASAPIRKERLSPTSKARREASRNEFVDKGGMPDRVESFQEYFNQIDSLF